MKKTKKLLILGMILAVVLSFGVLKTTSYAAEDDDGYADLNDITIDDDADKTTEEDKTKTDDKTTTDTNTTNTTNATNTTTNTTGKSDNVVSLNTTNTTNAANTATKDHPQAGAFMDVKVIAGVSIAAVALIIAFAKVKKYNY